MTSLEDLHDCNEKARREAESLAARVGDEDLRKSTYECIAAVYDLLRGRIDRGYYAEPKKQSEPAA